MPDLINGVYELVGGLFILLNVIRIHRDKKVRGVSVIAVAFFTSWGYWNLYYYPHLSQWASAIGGLFIAVMNTIWVSQMIYYIRKERNEIIP